MLWALVREKQLGEAFVELWSGAHSAGVTQGLLGRVFVCLPSFCMLFRLAIFSNSFLVLSSQKRGAAYYFNTSSVTVVWDSLLSAVTLDEENSKAESLPCFLPWD